MRLGTKGLGCIEPISHEELGRVVLANGKSMRDWATGASEERPAGVAHLMNPVRLEEADVFVFAGRGGWVGNRVVRPSADVFEFSVQHVRDYIEPTLALHTRWGLGHESLSDDLVEAETQAFAAVGDPQRSALLAISLLWWRREQYAEKALDDDGTRKVPDTLTDAIAVAKELDACEPPEHVVGRAAPAIIEMGERLIHHLLGVDLTQPASHQAT